MRVFVTALFGLVIALLGYHGTEQLGGVKASRTPDLGRFWPSPPILHLNLAGKNMRWFSFSIWNNHNEFFKKSRFCFNLLMNKENNSDHYRPIINETLLNHEIFPKTTVQFTLRCNLSIWMLNPIFSYMFWICSLQAMCRLWNRILPK